MNFHSEAIVLKSLDYQEADKLVTVFSAVKGKMQVIAKGVKKPGSSLRPLVQPFCHVQLYLAKGRNMDLLTQGKMLDFFGNLRQELHATMQAIYMMELLDKALLDGAALPALFSSTLQVLRAINAGGPEPLLLRYFEMRLLAELGYTPVLDRCVHCDSPEVGAGLFKLSEGGLLCPQCARNQGGGIALKPDHLALLRLLSSGTLQAVKRVRSHPSSLMQLEQFLEAYLEYHLERRFVTKNTMRFLKQNMTTRADNRN